MNRSGFIQSSLFGLMSIYSLKNLKKFSEGFSKTDSKMPVMFMGHGSPMNAIEDNEFSQKWQQLGKQIEKPQAVLCVSAHWLTKGTYVTAMNHPKTIHDFGGFPRALFEVEYRAPGNPELANEVKNIVQKTSVGLDHEWGIDHGTWSVVKHMYPDADIPVLQLSIDYNQPAQYHFDLAEQLASLRKKGVLIIGSGNMVHNLGMVAWDKLNEPEYGYDWALSLNETFKKEINSKNYSSLINYDSLGSSARLAIPTPDHYYPMIYTLGLVDQKEDVQFFNDKAVGGSLTMTSFTTV